MPSIPSRSRRCARQAELLLPGQTYLSVLIENEQGWVRQDYCCSCAEHVAPQGCFWRGMIPHKHQASRDAATILEKFQELYETCAQSPLISLFALYLERRGFLKRVTPTIFEEGTSGKTFHVSGSVAAVTEDDLHSLSEILKAYAQPSS